MLIAAFLISWTIVLKERHGGNGISRGFASPAQQDVSLAGTDLRQPGDVRQLLLLRRAQPRRRPTGDAASLHRRQHRTVAGRLQLPQHLYRGDWRGRSEER